MNSLFIDQSKLHEIPWQVNLIKNRDSYKCTYSEEGFEIKIFKDTLNTIQRLNYLDVTGISSSFKPKVACNQLFEQEGASNQHTFYYLGEYLGTWHMQQRYSLLDPRFFLYINHNSFAHKGQENWYLGAAGKYYPCLKEGVNEYNAYAYSSHRHETVVNVKRYIQFEPAWVHYYMTNTGEDPQNNLLTLKIEKALHMPSNKFYYELQLHENRTNFVSISNHDASIGESRIPVNVAFKVYEHWWTGSITVHNGSWRQLIDYGFPTTDNPFGSLTDSGLKEPILKGVSKVEQVNYTLVLFSKRKENLSVKGICL